MIEVATMGPLITEILSNCGRVKAILLNIIATIFKVSQRLAEVKYLDKI